MEAIGLIMRIVMLTRYSPQKGQRLEPGAIVEIEDEIAVDLIQRGLARPAGETVERAVSAAQE